jgi:CHAT domain-containing protein/tetratricopeptide (TPR) repeat protein
MGRYAAAEDYLSQALDIQRAATGARSPEVGKILSNLGLLRRDEALMREALEIERETLGERHPAVANSLTTLATILQVHGDSESAEALLRQAVEVGRAVQGEDHPEVGERLNNIALICAASGRQREALDVMKQVVAIDDRTVGKVFSFSTEARRAAFLRTIEGNFYKFLSLGIRYFADSAEVVRDLLDLVLRRKAIGAEALTMQRDVALGGRYPELRAKMRELTTLQRQIAHKELAGAGREGLDVHREILAGWKYAKEELEAELAQRIPEMDLEQTLRSVDRTAVAETLPEGSVLIEFVRCEMFDFQATEARGESQWRPAHYLAFVLHSRDPENITMVDLGEARVIDELIASFRSLVSGETGNGVSRDLGATPTEDSLSQVDDKGMELRQALIDPLLGAVGDCARLIFAPDGDITRLPLEVLPTDDGRRLIHNYRASYVGSGRDVLRFAAKSIVSPTQPIVAADPDFDLVAPRTGRETVAPRSPGRVSRDADCGRLASPLPATRTEGERVADMLSVEPWLSGAVLEARLKACHSPRILHLATHGFFLEEQKRGPRREFRDLGAPQLEAEPADVPESRFENPLLRSWLVLAGYNTWWKNQQPPPEAEDGILTAEDVVGLDLAATELVVLSACDTGLGVVRAGEGVFGMRRAFALAGAKTLVMSLWKVPDKQTQELMEDFYRRVLSGQPRSDALREAQLALSVKFPNPLCWGAFICQGNPAPLDVTR